MVEPSPPAAAVSPQAARGRRRSKLESTTLYFTGVRGLSRERVGHVDRDGSGGTVSRARAAVPAFVDVLYALPLLSSMATGSSGPMSTQSVQPSMHFDRSMVTGASARWGAKGMAVSGKVVRRRGTRSE